MKNKLEISVSYAENVGAILIGFLSPFRLLGQFPTVQGLLHPIGFPFDFQVDAARNIRDAPGDHVA